MLIDFGLTNMSDVFYEAEKFDDWGYLAASFIREKYGSDDGCELDLVRKYYDSPDIWDLHASVASTMRGP